MKINRDTVIILHISILLLGFILFLNFRIFNIKLLKDIIINIMCSVIVPIIICIVNYNIEKNKSEKNIINQLETYYSYLDCFYSLNIFWVKNSKKECFEKIELLLKLTNDLKERNNYFKNLSEELDYFFNKKKKVFYEDVKKFSDGFELEKEINDYINCYNHKLYTIKEVLKYCSEFAYEQMEKVDKYMEFIEQNYQKSRNWNEIKRKENMGFVIENNDLSKV